MYTSARKRLLVVLLSLAVVLVVTRAQSSDCSRHCFSGTLMFSEEDPADFSVGYTPCTGVADGQINNEAVEAFRCVPLQGASVALEFSSASYILTWTYSNSSGCDSAFNDARGTFAGALFLDESSEQARNITLTANDAGSLQDYASECGADCTERCFNVAVSADGFAGVSSPCGLNGTVECEITVLLRVVPCSGQVTSVDVLIGADGVRLSSFDPAQLASPSFMCIGQGQLKLQTAGLDLVWESQDVDCSVLLSDLSGLGSAPVETVLLVIGDEIWGHEGQQTPGSSLGLSTCALVDPDVDPLNDATDEAYFLLRPAKHALRTFVNCSSHDSPVLPADKCCTIFGYTNDNLFNVWTQRIQGSNWFVPGPSDRLQRRKFLADHTGRQSFGIVWDCNRHSNTKLFWELRHLAGEPSCGYSAVEMGVTKECDDSDVPFAPGVFYEWNKESQHRKYLIRTGVDMERNDCSDQDIIDFCFPEARR